jgi:hypothetical protein
MIRIRSQASSDYDPSFVTEALKEIEYSDTPNQDIDLLKDVAAQAYLGKSTHSHPICSSFWLTEPYLSGSRYHCFGNRNFLFGDGLLSRGAEEGSSRT